MYKPIDAVVVRASACQAGYPAGPWPDLIGPHATPTAWRAWLQHVWQIPAFPAAVRAASPDLAGRVAQICAGDAVGEADARRAVLAVLRYLLRGATRATPFGLFAGVAPVRVGAEVSLHVGTAHRAAAKLDATWITGVVEDLEADEAVRSQLNVVANNLAVERDGHLVLEHRSRGSAGGAPVLVQIRATTPAKAALAAARSQVRWSDLVKELAACFPAVPQPVIDRLLTTLLAEGLLITNLRPAMTALDPLTALISSLALSAADSTTAQGLRSIAVALARHNAATTPAIAESERVHIARAAANLRPGPKPAPALDLHLDWSLAIPEAVTDEAARAASILTRLASRPVLSSGWTAWHARFLDRYGPGAVVRVLDAVDADTGLGYPTGYLGSCATASAEALASRDKTLLKLAHTAAVRRRLEVVLDDATIEELAGVGAADPVQPSTELTVRVHAASLEAFGRGEFDLHVVGVSRAAGATTGRFLGLFNDDIRRRMTARYADLSGAHRGALLAQLSAPPLYANTQNVARAPRTAPLVVSLGEYPDSDSDRLDVSDLAVTADAGRLHLVSLSHRRPVHTLLLNAVDLAHHSHPLARFLLEAPVALTAPCVGFEWGAATALPFLPALRYGRTIISPARWVLAARDLPDRDSHWSAWDQSLTAWREEVLLPRHVYLGDGDQCINLDMAQPAHRVLLRGHVEREGRVLLRAAPAPQDLGWAGGRAHELVIPLAAAPVLDPIRWSGEIVERGHGHLPGCDGRLYLQLYGHRDRQDALLTRHLPQLVTKLGDARWWFVRYREPEDHLRLRLKVPGDLGEAAGQLAAWTAGLQRAGLLAHVSWETYYPETARFGGAAAIGVAEDFFAADSAAALAQLTAGIGKNSPDLRALTCASMVDIAAGLIGDDSEAMRWLIEHTRTDSTAPLRALYNQALALTHAGTDALGVGIAEAWAARRKTLAEYRSALERAGTLRPTDLLPDLLHLQQVRMHGPDIAQERASLHLARAAAMSWTVRRKRS